MEKQLALFHSEVEKFRSECNQNPTDTQKLKELANSLFMVVNTDSYFPESSKFLEEAKTIYLKVLELDQKDDDAESRLGMVYYYQAVTPYKDEEHYTLLCKESIKCFEKVLERNPDNFEANDWLGTVRARLPDQSPPQLTVMNEDGFRAQLGVMVAFEQDRQAAEAEDLKNPNNVDNLKKWGTALKMLAGICEDKKAARTYYEGAKDKFEKASRLNPEDKFLELEWMGARLELKCWDGDDGDTEYAELNERYMTLRKALRSDASLPAMSDKALSVNKYQTGDKSSKNRKKEGTSTRKNYTSNLVLDDGNEESVTLRLNYLCQESIKVSRVAAQSYEGYKILLEFLNDASEKLAKLYSNVPPPSND